MSSGSTFRVAMIGCGGITKGHLPAFESHPDKLQLAAACDPSEAAREAYLEKVKPFAAPAMFASAEEMLDAVAEEVDGVVIVTPHFLHYPQAKLCIDHGLPCLIEKPVCNNLAEGVALRAEAEAAGLTVMAGQTRRFDPYFRAARQWLRENRERFGPLRMFEMSG